MHKYINTTKDHTSFLGMFDLGDGSLANKLVLYSKLGSSAL